MTWPSDSTDSGCGWQLPCDHYRMASKLAWSDSEGGWNRGTLTAGYRVGRARATMDAVMREICTACRWIAALGLSFAMGGVLYGQGPAVKEAFQRGALAMHNGRIADAEQSFREAVKLAPKLPEAHLDLALALEREGKSDEAIGSLGKAIELDPKLPSAHMFLGIFLYQANRRDEAIAALGKELALDPKNGEAMMWMGIVQLAAGRPELAVGPLDRAAELSPNDLNLLEYRGKAHSLVAQNSYAKMAQIAPDSWQVHKVQAELYADEERHADAVKEYEVAIRQQARNADLYEGLGDQYRQLNQLDQARKAYERELELNPQNPIAMYNLGSTDVELGDHAAGVPLLQAMGERYRGAPVADYYLGRGLAGEGKDADAAAHLERSAEAAPDSEIAKRSFYELARVYRKMQRTADAEKALAQYNRLRETQDKKNAQKVQDWRKLSENGAAK